MHVVIGLLWLAMHLIWDWNGTLFADLHIVVVSVNASLEAVGTDVRIDADGYRDHYRRPVRGFYDALLGRSVGDPEWELINQQFHDTYHGLLATAGPADDAHDAAALAAGRGLSQSILSMWSHDMLVPTVAGLGLDTHMQVVRGADRAAGDRKEALLRLHMDELGLPASKPVVMVGDTFDDAHAAAEVAIGMIYYDGGSHHRVALDATGIPVAETLVEAVAIAATM